MRTPHIKDAARIAACLLVLPHLLAAERLSTQTIATNATAPQNTHTFTDDRGRTVTVTSCERVAALQGSLAAVWLLAGGTLAAVTHDALLEPPALTAEQADALNAQWHTTTFRAHDAGVLALVAERARHTAAAATIADIGAMMHPDSERLLALAPDFVILSANISGHRQLVPLLENAGIPCACFNYETFSQYLHILDIFTQLTDCRERYDDYGTHVADACKAQTEAALARHGTTTAPTVLLLRAFGTGVRAKDSRSLAAGDLLASLGTQNIADTGTLAAGDLSMEAIIAADPDFIFVTTMGADEQKALAAFRAWLVANPAWSGLSAVTAGRCLVLPRELFHFKPLGAAWLSCYQILTEILYGT